MAATPTRRNLLKSVAGAPALLAAPAMAASAGPVVLRPGVTSYCLGRSATTMLATSRR